MSRQDALDTFDQKILAHLFSDARVSWRDLADKIGLSLSPTIRRVRRLEEAGIIKGYYAAIDPGRSGATVAVFITVALEHQVKNVLASFEQTMGAFTEVVGGYQISGGADYLIHAVVESLDDYQQLLDKLTAVPGVSKIQSHFVVKTFVERPLSHR